MIDLANYRFKLIPGIEEGGEFNYIGETFKSAEDIGKTYYIPDFLESTTEIQKIGGYEGGQAKLLIDKLPNKLIALGRTVFSNYIVSEGITNLPETLKIVGPNCFIKSGGNNGNVNIPNLKIPPQITQISENCFYGNSSIRTLEIPEGVKIIGNGAFSHCENLESIILPSSLIYIDHSAFYNCTNLRTIEIPENNNLIGVGSNAFRNTQWYSDRIDNINKLLQDNIVEDKFLFRSGNDLIFLYLGNVMLECHNNNRSEIVAEDFKPNTIGIGGYGFINSGNNHINSDITKLTKLTLPKSINCISDSAFNGCIKLLQINLPDNIINIGHEAFLNTAWWENNKNGGIIYIDNYLIRVSGKEENIFLKKNTRLIASHAIFQENSIKTINIEDGGDTDEIYLSYGSICECPNLEKINFSDKKIRFYWYSIICDSEKIIIDNLNFLENCLFLGDLSEFKSYYGNTESVDITVNNLTVNTTLPNNAISLGWAYDELNITNVDILSGGLISGCSLSKCNIGSLSFSGKMEDGVRGYGAFTNSKVESIEIKNSDFIAEKYSFSSMELGEIIFPSKTQNWTEIKEGTFYDCKKLSSITLPESITYINDNAFNKCSDLEFIEFSDNVHGFGDFCFSNCNKLTTIKIPEGVTVLNKNLFENCFELVEITLPSTLKHIKQDAFKGCNKLTTINIPSIDLWFNIEFENKYSNPLNSGIAKLKVLGNTLINITIPKNLKKINDYLFYNYKSLTKFTIPNNQEITYLGKESFYGCEKLSQINLLGNNIKEIKEKTFSESGLTNIILPNTVERLDFMAFYNCKSLKTVTFGDLNSCKLNSLGISSFENCILLEKVEIPEKLLKIPLKCFKNCPELYNLVSENHIGFNIIEAEAFYGCSKLNNTSSNILFSNLSKVENGTFFGCGFTELSFSENLTNLEERCFENNTNLTSITFNNKSSVEIKKYSFKGCTKLKNINNIDTCTELIENYSLNDTLWYLNKEDGLIYIGTGLYSYKGTMPSGYALNINNKTTYISPYAFKDQTNLSTINTFPTSLKYLGKECFNGCLYLSGDLRLNTINIIGERAFKDCGILSQGIYVILSDYKSIEDYSEDIEITNINYIGNDAFRGCRFKNCEDENYLYGSSIYLPTTIEYLGHGVFQDIAVDINNQTIGVSLYKPNQIIITNGDVVYNKPSLKQIGEKSFSDSLINDKTNLKECSSLISIENEAFRDCSYYNSLSKSGIGRDWNWGDGSPEDIYYRKIYMPEGIEYIGNDAFKGFRLKTDIDGNRFPEGSTNFIFDFTNHSFVPRLGNSTTFEKSAEFIVPNSLYNKWINHSDWIYYRDNIKNQIDQGKDFVIDLGINYSYSNNYNIELCKLDSREETSETIFEKLLEYYQKAKISSYYEKTDSWIHRYQLNDFEKINLSYRKSSSEDWITWNNIKYLIFREKTPAGSTTPPPSGHNPEIDRYWGITLSPPPPGFKCAKIFEDNYTIKIYME